MIRAFASGIFAVACLMAAGSETHAQTVRGTIVNEATATVLPDALISLLDSAGVAVDSTRASSQGTFTLRVPQPGTYVLYFTHPGYASVPSSWLRLRAGETLEHRFEVPLISGAAIRRMREPIDIEKRLQTDLSELCGEPLRTSEAGMVVGVVRAHRGGEPLAGAIVRIEGPSSRAEPFRKATVSSANGVYVICNVPAGPAMSHTALAGYRADEGPVDVRAGVVAWYDVYMRPR